MPKITPNYLEMKAGDLPATKAFYESGRRQDRQTDFRLSRRTAV